jgi:ATPase subunit of ABC transporter with duplicated ATPase domains
MGERDLRRPGAIVPLLTVDSVVAGYRDPVVGPVSFTVGDGEVVGLAGPNGSGKTTLLGAIIGITRIFSGQITRHPGLSLSVQSQRPARLPEMPLTGLDLLHITGADRQVVPDTIAPFLPLRIDYLSGGQYQLLHVWACLASPAKLVLLDEPTNNIDPQAIVTLQTLIIAGRAAGNGAIIVSHNRALLESVCNIVVEVGS